jgi:hypothetical protein
MSTPKSINIAVAEQVEKLGSEKVISAVIDKLVQIEVTRRADALASAIKLSEDAAKELRKVEKPDQVFIAADGTKTLSYSQKGFDEKKKAEDKLAKIEAAVVAATEKGEWSKLYDVTKNSGKPTEAKPDDAQ